MHNDLRICWDKDPFVLTKITGSDINAIKDYCENNNLTIIEAYRSGNRFVIQAEKPNNRFRILRKRVEEIPGYKLIEDIPTKKRHWLTYEKLPVVEKN